MLKSYNYFQLKHKYILKSFMAIISLLLLFGFVVTPTNWKDNPYEMVVQITLITSIIISFLCFLKTDSTKFKTVFAFLLSIHFYIKFWTFPDTAIMLALFSIIPVIPIFLNDKIGFYITATANFFLGPIFIYYISNSDLQYTYTYIALDPFDNIRNYLAIQIIMFFLYIMIDNKIKSIHAYHKELQNAKQLNSIGQLAATIAHEIRNPITVVKGFAQLIDEKNNNLNDDEKFYIETILTELEYTEMIINDFLSLSKPQTEQMHILSLHEELQKVTDLLTSFANQYNTHISLNIKKQLFIKINRIDLKQLLVNIIKNGVEAMDQPGIITIDLFSDKDMALIKITDSGIGMSKEQVERLGTPFYSLKDRGTGIGLTVCYNIIQKYKGEIIVISEPNVGTTFYIYLPLHKI